MDRQRFGRASLLAATASFSVFGAAQADTVVEPSTVLTITGDSGFADAGPVLVPFGATLRLSDSAGGFSFANDLTVSGRGAPVLIGLRSRVAVETVLANGHTITATGNLFVSADSSIMTTGEVPFLGLSTAPGNGTLLLTGNISAVGTDPVTLGLGPNALVAGTITDGPSATLAMGFFGQTLTGTHSYSGGTGGFVRIFHDHSLGAASGPLLNITLTLAGDVVSAREIVGDVTVIAETGTTSVFSGTVTNDFTMRGPGNVTLSGPVTHPVDIRAEGPGTLTVSSAAIGPAGTFFPWAPDLEVVDGTLILTSADLLQPRSVVRIGGGTFRATGTPRPIALLNFYQDGGTFEFRQTAPTAGESMSVEGLVRLGGTLRIVPTEGYAPQSGDQIIVLTAGGIDGRHDRIIGPPGFLSRATVERGFAGPGSASLTVQHVALVDVAQSTNGTAAAQAVMRGASAGLPGALFGPGLFFGLSPEAVNGSDFDQLTPQRFQTLRNVAFDHPRVVTTALEHWTARTQEETGWHSFVGVPGTFGNVNPTPNTERAQYEGLGVVAGAGFTRMNGFSAGALFSYNDTDVALDQSGSKASARSAMPAVFAGYDDGRLTAQALLGYSFTDYETTRRVQIGPTYNMVAYGDTSGRAPVAALSAHYAIGDGPWRFGPALNASYVRLSLDGFTESGATETNLVLGDLRARSFRTQAGGFLSYAPTPRLHAKLKLQWQHSFTGSADMWQADFMPAGSGGFDTQLSSLEGDAIVGDLSVTAAITNRFRVFVDYGIGASRKETTQYIAAGLRMMF